MANQIKFSAGDKVYWLNRDGFQRGIIKQVQLTDYIAISNKKRVHKHEVKYLLWSERMAEVYMGDEVKEKEIFTSYLDMTAYYESLFSNTTDQ